MSHNENTQGLLSELRQQTGQNAARCYQCGKCSAGCPMAQEMSLRPHDIMRAIASGHEQRLFEGDSIWLCLTCETCTARCPNECDPARVIDFLREKALAKNPKKAPRPIRAFHKAFIRQIRTHGRVYEMGLIADYKLSGGALFQDVSAAPGMMARGKLALMPSTIDGIADVRRIVDACLAKSHGDHGEEA
ncbi:MAG: 4Fe-4S dicluster domain-containing protein [Myxococcota bacterium]|jgi:heterodisulfide reductase subunit C|nr:4Fe-4S dicluster domain-containing protein [Myxococcota bacterium]